MKTADRCWRMALGLLAVGPLLLTLGCTPLRVQTRMSPVEQAELRGRGLALLRRAAASDVDDVASNAIEALVQIDPEESAALFRAALRSDYPIVRFAGALAIGETRVCDVRDRLRGLLNDANAHVRLGAAFALYRCGDRSAGHLLTGALKSDPDERVRSNAAMLIGKIGESKAIETLRIASVDEKNIGRVHVETTAAMAKLGDAKAVSRLMQLVHYEGESRVIALQSLVEIALPDSRDALLYRLSREDEFLVLRLTAARALGRIGDAAGFELALRTLRDGPETVATIPVADRASEINVIRKAAAMALADIGDDRALAVLKRMAETETDAAVQVAACYALCRIIRPVLDASPPPSSP